ncbi:hypothetical protein Tco_1052852 [Tanacetum coccineum]
MAQPQRLADVHQDELCPPNKRYALMDANKKIDIDNPLYPNESKITANIIQNHPFRFSIAASSSVPWIYLERIFHLPQATDNNHEQSIAALKARDKHHNLEDDAMVKNILNLRKHKDGVGMQIPSWMITDEMKLTDHYRVYAEVFEKSRDELEAKQNVQKVEEHLIAKEIEKLVDRAENIENVEDDSSTLRQDDTKNILGTRLEPRSNKKSLEVEITVELQPVNINEEEEESVEDDYELKRRSPKTHSTLISLDTKKLNELTVTDPPPSSSTPSSSSPKLKLSTTNRIISLFKPNPRRFKRYKSFFDELQGCYGYLFEHLKTRFMSRKKFNVLAQHLQEIIEESLPTMVDNRVKEITKTQVPVYVAQGLIME